MKWDVLPHFSTDEEVKGEVEKWTKGLAGNYFEEGIKKLIPRFTTCIERNAEATEFYILHDNLEMKKLSGAAIAHNAPTHSSAVATAKLIELRYELPHPPYSPNLAPCDFFLYPNLKKWLGGKKFTSNEKVIAKTKAYFAEFDKSYFSEGLKKWQKRWEKCILLKVDYDEK
ncbi:MOS1T transposase, partial [Pseudoatta argentina]